MLRLTSVKEIFTTLTGYSPTYTFYNGPIQLLQATGLRLYLNMSDMIRHILKRYPEDAIQIRHLVLRNSNFHTICEDYGKCVAALKYWDQSKDCNAKAKAEDYRNLIQELEKEIVEALLGPQPRPPD